MESLRIAGTRIMQVVEKSWIIYLIFHFGELETHVKMNSVVTNSTIKIFWKFVNVDVKY